MGAAAWERPATEAERARMRGALGEALHAGALGLSTSVMDTDRKNRLVPSRLADDRELRALVETCRGRIWQINIASKGATSDEGRAAAIAELDRYAEWSRQLETLATWSPLVVAPGDKVTWRRLQEFSGDRSDSLLAQVCPQSFCSTISFDGPSYASMVDGWARLLASRVGRTRWVGPT